MKAIVIAAGMAKRLQPLTDQTPKSMLPIQGKSMLQRAVQSFKKNGIQEIAIIRGFCADKIVVDHPVTFFENPNFKQNNILHSLLCAESFMDGEMLISYSDILFKDEVVKKACEFKGDIGAVIDRDWQSAYAGRDLHPLSEAEVAKVEGQQVKLIGKNSVSEKEATGEFIGMVRLSAEGTKIFKSEFARLKKTYRLDQVFQRAACFEKSYLTDFLQELIDRGFPVQPILIDGGWMEIDTPQDYQKAQHFYDKR